jgi:hypothetical protein
MREMFKDFSEEEQQRLIAQLKRLSAALELALSSPAEEHTP